VSDTREQAALALARKRRPWIDPNRAFSIQLRLMHILRQLAPDTWQKHPDLQEMIMRQLSYERSMS